MFNSKSIHENSTKLRMSIGPTLVAPLVSYTQHTKTLKQTLREKCILICYLHKTTSCVLPAFHDPPMEVQDGDGQDTASKRKERERQKVSNEKLKMN